MTHTEKHLIDHDAKGQRGGVLATLSEIGESFKLLPPHEESPKHWLSLEKWAGRRHGWIFITSRPALREALLPLISLWLDLLVLRLLTEPHPHQRPAWFVIDELASLAPAQLHTAITENRKSNNPIIPSFKAVANWKLATGRMLRPCSPNPQPRSSCVQANREPPSG
jgi:hypothetical protein